MSLFIVQRRGYVDGNVVDAEVLISIGERNFVISMKINDGISTILKIAGFRTGKRSESVATPLMLTVFME